MIEMVNDNWRSGPREEVCTFKAGHYEALPVSIHMETFVSYGLAFYFGGTVLISNMRLYCIVLWVWLVNLYRSMAALGLLWLIDQINGNPKSEENKVVRNPYRFNVLYHLWN